MNIGLKGPPNGFYPDGRANSETAIVASISLCFIRDGGLNYAGLEELVGTDDQRRYRARHDRGRRHWFILAKPNRKSDGG
jgi:hypothetical protein